MLTPDQLDHDIFHPRHLDEADSFYNIVGRMEQAGIWFPDRVTFLDPQAKRLDYSVYFNWLNWTVRDYLKNPEDFYYSWNFIEGHPIFWHQHSPESRRWSLKSGIHSMVLDVLRDANGHTLFSLEHGPIVAGTNYTSHDHYLDVYKGTYDEAVIEMASLVLKYYGIDGDPYV